MSKASDETQFDTRKAYTALLGGLDHIEASLESAPLDRQVEIGSILWDMGDRIRDVLDKIKETVREEALARNEGQSGMVLVEGDDLGEASVNIPDASLRIPKGTNIEDLKRVLGTEFGLFYEEVVTVKPRREFAERVPSVQNPLHQQILLDSVQRVEGTPRVSFRRNRPSRRDQG